MCDVKISCKILLAARLPISDGGDTAFLAFIDLPTTVRSSVQVMLV